VSVLAIAPTPTWYLLLGAALFTIGGVDGTGERGALGIALDPAFPATPFVYVYVTRNWRGALRNQLVRITKSGAHGLGLRVLVSTPASSTPYHNGGRILFGPDHKLYVMIGEGHHAANAQDLTANLRGKILRLDVDAPQIIGKNYAIPATNPYAAGGIAPGAGLAVYGGRTTAADPRGGCRVALRGPAGRADRA